MKIKVKQGFPKIEGVPNYWVPKNLRSSRLDSLKVVQKVVMLSLLKVKSR